MSNAEQVLDPSKPASDQIEAFLVEDMRKSNLQEAKSYIGYPLDVLRAVERKRKALDKVEAMAKVWLAAAKSEVDQDGTGEDAYNTHNNKTYDILHRI